MGKVLGKIIATNVIKITLGNVYCFTFKVKAATIMLSGIAWYVLCDY